MRRSKIDEIPLEEFQKLIQQSTSIADFFRRVGMRASSGSYSIFNRRVKREQIPLDHFCKDYSYLGKSNKIPNEEILVENSTYASTNSLKKRLIKDGLLVEKCSECGSGATWNNKPLVLQLDHINGISNDNRLKNLRLLCPNCHSQTPTFCGKERKAKVSRCICGKEKHKTSSLCKECAHKAGRPEKRIFDPSREELKKLLDLGESYVSLGKRYGVSGNAVRKRAKKFNLI